MSKDDYEEFDGRANKDSGRGDIFILDLKLDLDKSWLFC